MTFTTYLFNNNQANTFLRLCMRNKRHSNYQIKYKRIRDYLIHLNSLLGQGSCGKVFKAVNEKSQRNVAVKVIDKKLIRSDQYLKQLFMQEIEILRKIHSEHIVAIIEILESDNNFYLVQELCDHTLQDLISNPKPMSQMKVLQIMSQVAKAFTVLVREGVMHRDLKPANILMKDGQVKVTDFGFAKDNVSQKMVMKSFVGSPLYMSPQMLEKEPYSSKSDVWSFGIIFYELLYKRTPWKADSPQGLLKRIKQEPLRLHPNLSSIIADFLIRTLALDETDRLSWDEVFYHQIFVGTFDHLKQKNMQIQDKLKMTMTALRQDITRKNISILQLLQTMQLKDNLTLHQFTKFIKHISPSLMPQEIRRIFDKLDTDCSGTVEIVQIQAELKKHNIQIDIPPLQRFNSLPIQQEKQSGSIGKLVRNVFRQLMQGLKDRKLSLKKIFDHFANGQPSIDLKSFTKMLDKIGQFDNQEVKAVFGEIDVDNSNSIQYHQIAELFSKVNNVPPSALEQS